MRRTLSDDVGAVLHHCQALRKPGRRTWTQVRILNLQTVLLITFSWIGFSLSSLSGAVTRSLSSRLAPNGLQRLSVLGVDDNCVNFFLLDKSVIHLSVPGPRRPGSHHQRTLTRCTGHQCQHAHHQPVLNSACRCEPTTHNPGISMCCCRRCSSHRKGTRNRCALQHLKHWFQKRCSGQR